MEKFLELHENKKLSSLEWSNLIGVTILDPDGWNRRDFKSDFGKEISLMDFLNKAARSTTNFPQLYVELLKLKNIM